MGELFLFFPLQKYIGCYFFDKKCRRFGDKHVDPVVVYIPYGGSPITKKTHQSVIYWLSIILVYTNNGGSPVTSVRDLKTNISDSPH